MAKSDVFFFRILVTQQTATVDVRAITKQKYQRENKVISYQDPYHTLLTSEFFLSSQTNAIAAEIVLWQL